MYIYNNFMFLSMLRPSEPGHFMPDNRKQTPFLPEGVCLLNLICLCVLTDAARVP